MVFCLAGDSVNTECVREERSDLLGLIIGGCYGIDLMGGC